jgi:uncharacterized repeat protein (TIGR02543 family)
MRLIIFLEYRHCFCSLSLIHYFLLEKGKPSERAGRKASGLSPDSEDKAAGLPGVYGTTLGCHHARLFNFRGAAMLTRDMLLRDHSLKFHSLFLTLITFLSILSSSLVFSAEIKLAWDANAESDLAGYKIYYGTSPRTGTDPKSCNLCGYSAVVTAGKVTSYTIGSLITGQNYYVSLSATDTSGNESGFSNEVSGTAKDSTSTQNYTITTNPAGLGITVDGTTYTAPQTFGWVQGSSHTLSVSSPQGGAGSRYIYGSWSDGGAQTHTVTVPSSSATYTASFSTQYSLTTTASPSGGGTVNPSGVNWYNIGQSVSVSATANAGYSFSSWTGDLTGSTNPTSLTMGGPKSLTANFTQNQYTVTVSVNPSAGGSVTKSPNKSTYVYGDQVTLTAAANTGYTFGSWSGDASGTTSPATVTVNGNKAVTATFTAIPETVSTPTMPAGSGSGVTGTSYSYSTGGATSSLSHSVEYQFDWKGDGSDLSPWGVAGQSKTWTVAGTYQVRARARCVSHTGVVSGWSGGFSVTISQATVSFTVATIPSGLQVGVDGTTYAAPRTFNWVPGTSHTISVSSPQSGATGTQYVYSSWSDGGAQSHTVTVPTSSVTYTANFSTQYSLTTTASPSGGGTVSPSGANWYNSGQSVSVSATANAGYSFSSWTGDQIGSTNPISLTMGGPKSLTANFIQNQYTAAVNVNPSAGGSVTKSPNKSTYVYGDQVTLTAAANTGYTFSSWSGDASGTTNPVTLTINGNKTATVNFVNSISLGVSPSDGLSVSGTQGGPFSQSSQTYMLQNKGVNPINWTASKTQPWVSLSSKGGNLSPGGTVSVKVSINNNANQLKAGSYNDNIIFSNTAKGNETVSIPVALMVSPLLKTYTVQSSPSGLQIIVDGTNYTAPQTFNWTVGSFHTLTAPSPQSSPGVQYYFNSWSFWTKRNHGQTITAPASGATYTAYFTSQPASSQSADSSGGAVATVSGGNLLDRGGTDSPHRTFSTPAETTALPMIGELESPSEGRRVYGIKTIYGWALDGEGISKVKLYMDGEFVCDIPYGGLIEGLRNAYPNYPDAERGGFALVWDYSSLSSGDHFVQIEVLNVRGEVLKLGANILVQNISGDMVNQGNLSEVLIPGIKLTVGENTNTYDLRLEWSKESQVFEIIDLYPR